MDGLVMWGWVIRMTRCRECGRSMDWEEYSVHWCAGLDIGPVPVADCFRCGSPVTGDRCSSPGCTLKYSNGVPQVESMTLAEVMRWDEYREDED